MSKADNIFFKRDYDIEDNTADVTYTKLFSSIDPREIIIMKNGCCKINGILIEGIIIKAIAQKFEEKGWL